MSAIKGKIKEALEKLPNKSAVYNLPDVGGSSWLSFLGRYPVGAGTLVDSDYELAGGVL